MKSPKDHDNLKGKLAAWRVEPEFRPDFNREVWRKIAASNPVQRENFWRNLFAALFIAPRFAAVTAMGIAMLSLSLGTAHVMARNANSRNWTMLQERYAQSIDPLTRSTMKE